MKTRNRQKGVAAVEMALIVLPLLVVCFGITELGRALYLYNGLVKASRNAARYLSLQNLNAPPPGETVNSLRDKAISLAYCGALSCAPGAEPLVPGLSLAADMQISVCDPLSCPATHKDVPAGAGAFSMVSVTIGVSAGAAGVTPYTYQNGGAPQAYVFHSVVPWVVPDIAFGSVTSTMPSSF